MRNVHMMHMSPFKDAIFMMRMSHAMVHAMMRMSHWCMLWCECPFGDVMNANARLWVYHDTSALMQTQFIQKFLLFLKRGFHNA